MTNLSFVFKIFFTFILLSWFYLLVSSAAGADSIPFPKEPIAASTRMEDKLGERFAERDTYVLAFINFTYNAPDGEEIRRSEEKARYGEGRILNVQGHLVHVTKEFNSSDHSACTENIRGTMNKPLPPRGEPWIALVRRGACTFEKKIRHVWLHGAAGVIVYNDEASVSLEKMKIIDKERNITAVFTFKWIGEEMARVVDNDHKVWVSISEGSRGYRPSNINKTSVLFVSISFIILMVISLIWLIFYYIQRFRYLQSKDQHARHLCTAAKRIIMKIPTKSGKCEDKDNESDCCAICIENYKSSDCIRVLPCRHEFHKNCIDPWLLEHRTCPMCKLDILKHYGFVIIGSQESFMDIHLDEDLETGNRRLSRRRTRRGSDTTTTSFSSDSNSVNSLSPDHRVNRGHLHIAGSRIRSSSLQFLSPIVTSRKKDTKSLITSEDGGIPVEIDSSNIRLKPTFRIRMRSKSADAYRGLHNHRRLGATDYFQYVNISSTSQPKLKKKSSNPTHASCSPKQNQIEPSVDQEKIETPQYCNIKIQVTSADED